MTNQRPGPYSVDHWQARIDRLTEQLTGWLRCAGCDGSGEQCHEATNGDTMYYGCPDCDSTGCVDCGPPDPADYYPHLDITGEDRSEAVAELYRLKGGKL